VAYYRLVEDSDTYNSVMPGGDIDLQLFDGQRLASSWEPLEVQVFSQGNEPDFLRFLPGAFAMPESSWSKVSHILRDDAEALPLKTVPSRTNKLVAVNPIRVIDCFDHQRGRLSRLPSGAVEFPLESYAFLADKAAGATIFRLPETKCSEIIATEYFCQLIVSMKLKGLTFKSLR
jgi:hypothetical protein